MSRKRDFFNNNNLDHYKKNCFSISYFVILPHCLEKVNSYQGHIRYSHKQSDFTKNLQNFCLKILKLLVFINGGEPNICCP